MSKTPIACCVGYMHRKICWRVQGFGRTRLRQEVSGAISLRETPEECTLKQIQRWLLLFVSGPKSVSQLLSYSKEISMAGDEQSEPFYHLGIVYFEKALKQGGLTLHETRGVAITARMQVAISPGRVSGNHGQRNVELSFKGICKNLPRQVSALPMLMRLNKSKTTVHGYLILGVRAGERGKGCSPRVFKIFGQNAYDSGKSNWDKLFIECSFYNTTKRSI